MKTSARVHRLIATALWVLLISPARADVIDRILAVVAGQPIMLSDVNAALTFQLIPPPAGDRVSGARDRLIERALMLTEVERYQPAEPAGAAVDERLSAIQQAAGSPAALDQRLAIVGFSRDQLRRYVRDDLRIKTYLDQRFGSAALPSDSETMAYYRQHPEEFTSGGVLAPFDQIAEPLRARLAASRRAGLIAEWLASLRRRADIAVLPLSLTVPISERSQQLPRGAGRPRQGRPPPAGADNRSGT